MDDFTKGIHVILLLCLTLYAATDQHSVDTELANLVPTRPCDEALSVELINPHTLSNGSLLADDGYLYAPGDFWTDMSSDNKTVIRGCACQKNSCVRKCCPENHNYVVGQQGHCKRAFDPLLQPFKPKFEDVVNDIEYSKIRFLYGDPCKDGKYSLLPAEPFHLYGNGTLFMPAAADVPDSVDVTTSPHLYCLEVIETDGGSRNILPFICFTEYDEDVDTIEKAEHMLYAIGMILSLPFLIATFVVYAIIPELRNLHGKSLMSHVVSLFVAYLFLSTIQLGQDVISDAYCNVAAFIVYFSFLASFFWLNVMCFDLWWTFSGFRPLRGSVRERDHKKFIIYSLYSWGSPLIMLAIVLIMDLAAFVPNELVKPGFGLKSCWFQNKTSTWAYFYGPVAVILTANLIMFVTTALKIVKLKRETAMLKGTDSKRHDDDENNQRFSLYLKLFIVMGVNWAMEVISAAVEGPKFLWYVTDLGNTLQGVLIFIIFVWKDKIRKLLIKRFNGGAADSKSRNSSSASKTTRVFSSTRTASLKNMSSQGDFNMTPIPRNECASNVP